MTEGSLTVEEVTPPSSTCAARIAPTPPHFDEMGRRVSSRSMPKPATYAAASGAGIHGGVGRPFSARKAGLKIFEA